MRPFTEIAQIVAQSRASPAPSEHIEERDYGGMLLQEWETVNKRVERAFAERPKDVRRDWKQITIEIFMCIEDTKVKVEQWYFGYTGQPAFTVRFERVLYRSLYCHLRLLPANTLKAKRLRHLTFEVNIVANKPSDTLSRNNECVILKFMDSKGAMTLSYDFRDDLFDLLQQSGKRTANAHAAPLAASSICTRVDLIPVFDPNRDTTVDSVNKSHEHEATPTSRQIDRRDDVSSRRPPPSSSSQLGTQSMESSGGARARASSHGAKIMTHGRDTRSVGAYAAEATVTAPQDQQAPPALHQYEQYRQADAPEFMGSQQSRHMPHHGTERGHTMEPHDGHPTTAIPMPHSRPRASDASPAMPAGSPGDNMLPLQTTASSAPINTAMRPRSSTMPEHDYHQRRRHARERSEDSAIAGHATNDARLHPRHDRTAVHPAAHATDGIPHAGVSSHHQHEYYRGSEPEMGGLRHGDREEHNLRENASAAIPIPVAAPRARVGSAGSYTSQRPHPTPHHAASSDGDLQWYPGSLPISAHHPNVVGRQNSHPLDLPYGLPFARSYGSSWNDHANVSAGLASEGASGTGVSRGLPASLRSSRKPSPLSHSFGSAGGSDQLRVSFLHSNLSPKMASGGLSDSRQSLASQDLTTSVASSADDEAATAVDDIDLAFEHLPFAWEDKEEGDLQTFRSKINEVPKLTMFAAAREDVASSMSHLDVEMRACHNEAELFERSLAGQKH
eukprot:m.332891 g.332891  ORF g.332891 m.332891 type:complete len:731 (-) comp20496_c0_seq5:131-2323(-)